MDTVVVLIFARFTTARITFVAVRSNFVRSFVSRSNSHYIACKGHEVDVFFSFLTTMMMG